MGIGIRQGYIETMYMMAGQKPTVLIYAEYTLYIHQTYILFTKMNDNDIMLSIKIIKNQLLEEL